MLYRATRDNPTRPSAGRIWALSVAGQGGAPNSLGWLWSGMARAQPVDWEIGKLDYIC